MVVYVQLALVLLIALSIEAQPLNKLQGSPKGGPPPFHMGPFHSIIPGLTQQQIKELHSIMGKDLKKSEIKTKLDAFVAKLSQKLKDMVKKAKARLEAKKAADEKKVKSLSESAQKLFSSIEGIMKDDSITPKQEHEKIHKLLESADKKTMEELLKAGIHPPGPHGPHPN